MSRATPTALPEYNPAGVPMPSKVRIFLRTVAGAALPDTRTKDGIDWEYHERYLSRVPCVSSLEASDIPTKDLRAWMSDTGLLDILSFLEVDPEDPAHLMGLKKASCPAFEALLVRHSELLMLFGWLVARALNGLATHT